MPRKTTRLYYGQNKKSGQWFYWTLKVRNATKPVKLSGTVEDAMNGKPGISIACHLAVAAARHADAFPHPVLFVSFTKSVVLVVTKIKDGKPVECVRYRHPYSKYVNLNDDCLTKKKAEEHPALFNRQFTLGVYRTQQNHWKPEYGRRETGERKHLIPIQRGEIGRFHKAGLINRPDLAA